jgi:predicted transposase YdaD
MDALEQSSFYQFLVDKGRVEGRDEGLKTGEQIGGLNEARRLVALIGRSNLGQIPQVNLRRLNNITSLEKLEQLLLSLNDASSWDALLPGD